jgi:superfamily I DNA/RNA helicase
MAYYFNPPSYSELTTDQKSAVDEPDSLALSGGPGTGKSVVCLWRHIRNYETGSRESLLLTYTKTLENFLRGSALKKNRDAAKNINRTLLWSSRSNLHKQYDEIIIDEGQDIELHHYKTIKKFSKNNISYGADRAQSLYLNEDDLEELMDWLEDTFENEDYTLSKNFRNSKEILDFIRSVFPDILIPQETLNGAITTGLKPIMKITDWDDSKELESIMSIINDYRKDTHNIGILVASQKDVDKYYSLIRDELDDNVECSKFQAEMGDFESLSGIHITTFKSSKGTEFDTVIIPNFDRFDYMISKNYAKEQDYYVALTRAKINLFLISKKNPKIGNSNTYDIE